jgi:hypothetical protein
VKNLPQNKITKHEGVKTMKQTSTRNYLNLDDKDLYMPTYLMEDNLEYD